MNYGGKYNGHNIYTHKCVILVQSTKVGTHKNTV